MSKQRYSRPFKEAVRMVTEQRLNRAEVARRVVLPPRVRHWTLTTLREKLIKIGAKMVHHARYVTFQMAEVAVPRSLYREILRRIARLGEPARPPPR